MPQGYISRESYCLKRFQIVKLTVERSGNKNIGIIKESVEIDDLVAPKEPKLFRYILILRLSNKVGQRPRTDIVRETDSAWDSCPNRADLSLALFILYREALYILLL